MELVKSNIFLEKLELKYLHQKGYIRGSWIGLATCMTSIELMPNLITSWGLLESIATGLLCAVIQFLPFEKKSVN